MDNKRCDFRLLLKEKERIYMYNRDNLNVNEKGNLTIGGVDCCELADKYKTPLYVMDEQIIRKNCRVFKKALKNNYDGYGEICYASKAFATKEIYRIMKQEKMKIDCVSQGEIYTALSVNYPAQDIYFHGNNKTKDEILYAIKNRIGRVVIDNFNEIEQIDKIAEKEGIEQDVLIRLKPGIQAHTHEFVKTGQIDSKFGFSMLSNEAMEAVDLILRKGNLNLVGIHTHIGSQIFETEPYELATNIMIDFIDKVKENYKYNIKELDMGGGFPVRYKNDDPKVEYNDFIKAVSMVIKKRINQDNCPKLILEPGRSIVGSAGITLYRVGAIKEIKDIRTYVAIDGGMTDNPRYALYRSKYEAMVASKAKEDRVDDVTIVGKCCETGDIIGEQMKLQSTQIDDIVAILDTGAYNYSMASNYNRMLKPAVVMVNQGKSRIIVKRQSLEDIVLNDI